MHNKVKMPLLQAGDLIGIATPARKMTAEDMQPFEAWCKQNQWEVYYPTHRFKSDNQMGGTDAERIADMNELLAHPDIKVIFSGRGGYGCLRIVDQIDWSLLQKNPKWICGYSDLSVFHYHINHVLKLPSLHCLMPVSFIQYDSKAFETSAYLTAMFLKTGTLAYELPSTFTGLNWDKHFIYGGNLSVLYSLSGANNPIIPSPSILFLEDLDEYLYHIDRMMWNLKRSGFLQKFKGLFLGSFTDIKDNAIPFGKTAEEIIESHAAALHISSYRHFPAGHIAGNFPIPFGYKVRIQNNTLTFEAP